MPKQSRVKKPPLPPVRELLVQVFERLCKLETQAVVLEEQVGDEVGSLQGRIRSLGLLGDSPVKQGDTAQGQINQLKKDLDVTQRALLEVESRCKQLQERMNSDFDDQDDEIEKLRRQVQSIDDKLKVKQLGEQTNVELTARVKELQRQLTDANDQLEKARANNPWVRVVETIRLDDGRIADREYIEELRRWVVELTDARNKSMDKAAAAELRADRAEAELTGVRAALAEHIAARPKPLFWGRFGELRKNK